MQKSARQCRPDELAYDPKDQIILIANPDEASAKPTPGVPFISFISTATVTPSILGKIIYDGNTTDGPAATAIEQPVWDGLTGKFYLTIPESAYSHPVDTTGATSARAAVGAFAGAPPGEAAAVVGVAGRHRGSRCRLWS